MDIDDSVRRAGRNFQGLPGYGFFERNYPKVANAIQNFKIDGSTTLHGFYRINPPGADVEPYKLWITNGSHHNRLKVLGKYEVPVMKDIADRVDSETVFWEVGAALGYYSVAMAQKADQVVAFDTSEESLGRLTESAEENGFDNVEAVVGKVGFDVDLSKFETPTIVLMDIEGWEYTTLTNSTPLLENGVTLYIEIHEPTERNSFPKENDVEALMELLKEYGYRTEELFRRRPTNYIIRAEKSV